MVHKKVLIMHEEIVCQGTPLTPARAEVKTLNLTEVSSDQSVRADRKKTQAVTVVS